MKAAQLNRRNSRAAEARGPAFARLATSAMGTRFEFVLVGEDEAHLRAVGEEAIEEIRYLHEKFSYFSPASIVTRINQRAAHEPVDVDRETFELLETCRDVWEQSGGAFDITIAPLMHEYGFRGQDSLQSRRSAVAGTQRTRRMEWSAESRNESTPFPLSVPSVSSVVSLHYVQLDRENRTVRFAHPGMAIDLGGVAKGYALDRAAATCRENGISCGLLHGGTSTVVALGALPNNERGWGVRIQDEIEPLTVHVRDEALSVSAPRGRTVEKDGTTRDHIIDPRSGKPATGITTAAVVCTPSFSGRGQGGGSTTISESGASPTPQSPPSREGEYCATLADAWSTALLVQRSRPSTLSDSYTTLIRRDDTGWTCSPAGCHRAANKSNSTART